MSSGTPNPGIPDLAAHAGFVRALARSLVVDPHRADDVAQQTLLTALSRQPTGVRRPRAWLATVAKNLARRGYRSDRRRGEREEKASHPARTQEAVDLAAQLETTQRLVRAVGKLREPFRETVLLRFFEDLSPEEIARKKGIPSSTVRGRLSRALAMLRDRLDEEHGNDRRSWSLALLPLALPSGRTGGGFAAAGGVAAVLGGLAMSGKKIAVLVTVALALCVGGSILLTHSPSPVPPDPDETAVADLADDSMPLPTETGAPGPVPVEVASAGTKDWPVRVKTNVPGAEVRVALSYYGGEPNPAPLTGKADADGLAGFELPVRRDPLHLARATATAPNYEPATAKIESGTATLNLQPGRPVRGRVQDEDGRPVEGAVVQSWGLPARSDGDGRFTVHLEKGRLDAEGVERFPVTARHRSFVPGLVRGVTFGDEPVITLRRGRSVSGRIVDAKGRPVPYLRVMAQGQESDRTRTAEDGTFHLGALPAELRHVSVAIQPRFMGDHPGGGAYSLIDITGNRSVTWNAGRIHMVRVLVRDEDGRPFRHAELAARDEPSAGWGGPISGDTGEAGEAVFSAGSAQRVEIDVMAPGRMPATGVVEFTEDSVLAEVTVVLRRIDRPGSLDLTVRTSAGEVPGHAFLTLARGEVGLQGFSRRRIDLDEEGRIRIDGIPPGDYGLMVLGSLEATTEGYALHVSDAVTIEPGVVSSFRAELPIGGRVKLTVTDRAGNVVIPPWNTTLVHRKDRSHESVLSHIHPGGGFGPPTKPGPVETLTAVPAGRYYVVVRREGRVIGEAEVGVSIGRTVEVRMAIED